MKPLRTATKVLLALVLLGAATWMFAPESRIESARQAWRRASGDVGQLCLDEYKSSLQDPGSAIYEEEITSAGRVMVRYRATNALGAYMQGVFSCPLRSDGDLDKAGLLSEKLDQLGKDWKAAQ